MNERASFDPQTQELSLWNRKQRLLDRIDEAVSVLDSLDLRSDDMREALKVLSASVAIDSDKLKISEMEHARHCAYRIAELATLWIEVAS